MSNSNHLKKKEFLLFSVLKTSTHKANEQKNAGKWTKDYSRIYKHNLTWWWGKKKNLKMVIYPPRLCWIFYNVALTIHPSQDLQALRRSDPLLLLQAVEENTTPCLNSVTAEVLDFKLEKLISNYMCNCRTNGTSSSFHTTYHKFWMQEKK